MLEQFIPYPQALKLKELGFDELCFAREYGGGFSMLPAYDPLRNSEVKESWYCVLPLWQQAFDWFREGYWLDSFCRAIDSTGKSYWKISKLYEDGNIKGYSGFSDTIEKARLECLNKLIELAEDELN